MPSLAQDVEPDENVLPGDDTQQTGVDVAADEELDDSSPFPASQNKNTIVVSGSRIPRSTFETPAPVTIVDREFLLKSSPSTLAAALNNLPALVSEGGPNQTSGQRTAGRNTLNLRGIGANRTLVLVNGHRFPGSSPTGTVDTNLIPQGLVERVEVVTGGASAAYGSDAVAGVVNFILNRRYEGLKLAGSLGLAQEGDGFERRVNATYGTKVGDRLHFVLAGEWYKADGIDGGARAYARQGANLIPNPNADGTAANPDLIVADRARLGDATFGGYIASTGRGTPAAANVLIGQQFLQGGVLGPFDMGINNTGSLQDGGDGVNTAALQPITRPLERATGYAGIYFEATDNLRLYANGGYGWTRASNAATAFHSGRFGATISSDNAFLDPGIAALLGSSGTFRINRYDSEYLMEVVATNRNKRIEAGFELDIGRFTLDVSGQLGRNKERALNYNNFVPDLYAQGIDSIIVNGQAVCRDQSNGCVPINPFGVGSYTPEMIEFFTDTSLLETRVKQDIVQANLVGDLFDGVGAGPWGIALGAEYRHDDVEIIVDPISQANGFFTNNFQAYAADRSVKEAFVELNAPLLEGVPGAQLLEINAAARITDYTFSGTVETWKVGLNYKPFKDLRLRGTISRDIRAPGLGELFTVGRQTNRNTYFDPATNSAVTPLTAVRGNPFLVPEIANTYIFGAVYQPSWAPGLSLSVDRFEIKMDDALNTLSGQDIIDQCEIEGFQQACQQITRDANGVITEIRNSNFNLDQLKLVGWDFEGRYTIDFGEDTSLTLRATASLLEQLEEQDFQNNTIDRVGETTTPKWRALASVNLNTGPFNAFLQARYIGKNVLNVRFTDVDSEYFRVPDALYLDGQIGWNVDEDFEFYINIQNLLDKDPVFAPTQDTYFNPTTPNVYDPIGRAFRVGVRKEF